ncbi:MAG: hypothetical protein RBU30_01410 [Polyangia bacterium]|nr:hypothetical protein [Polyangia bacterium]
MNFREAKIVTRFDYKNLVRSAPGVTFLILYLYVAINLGAWLAEQLRGTATLGGGANVDPEMARQATNSLLVKIVSWFLGGKDEVVRFLVFDRPVAMSAFFLLSLLVMPILVLFLSFNQISGYVSRRSIRYIVPKTGRLELYLGLFASNLLFFSLVSGALTAVMTVGWVLASKDVGTGVVVGYSLQILAAVWLSCIPIIALMSMLAAMTGSPVATVFLGLGTYLVVILAGYFMSAQTEWGKVFYYLLPLEPKYWFAYPSVGHFIGAGALMLLYAAAYLALGWLFLRRRNL